MKTTVRVRVVMDVSFQECWSEDTTIGKVEHDGRLQAVTKVENLLGSGQGGALFRVVSISPESVTVET